MAEQPGPDDTSDDVGDDADEQAGADGSTDEEPTNRPDGESVDRDDESWPPASRADAQADQDEDSADPEDASDGSDDDATAVDAMEEANQLIPDDPSNPEMGDTDASPSGDDDATEATTKESTTIDPLDDEGHLGPDELYDPEMDDPDAAPEVDEDVDGAESLVEEAPDGDLELADHIAEQGVQAADEETEGEEAADEETEGEDPLDDVEDPYEELAETNYEATTSTPASATGQPGATPAGAGAGASGGGGGGGYGAPSAPDDQEMPLGEHIEEMVRRLGVVIVVMAAVSAIAFPFADRVINFLWYSFLPGSFGQCPVVGTNEIACPYLYHPLALMFARLKIAALAGFVIALPVMVYESYLFMRPGLYPRERRYYLASVPTSLVLAIVGVIFAYLLVLPVLFQYFTQYTNSAAEVAFGLSDTFNLIVMMLGFFALIFQIPLFIMLAIMMGVTSRRWLASRRIYFYGGFATIAFVFSPDPTGMAPILVAVTMIVLFEGTLLLLKWTRESSPIPSAQALAARRPLVWALTVLAGYLASGAPVPAGYYDSVPTAVTDALAAADLLPLLPVFIGLVLIAGYELVALVARRRAGVRVRYTLARGRAVAWPLALVVGYFGSPNPVLVERVDALALELPQVALLVVAIAIGFELLVGALALNQRRHSN